MAEQAEGVGDVASAEGLERSVRGEGLQVLGRVLEQLLQAALDQQPAARACPACGEPRRHKGQRTRGVLSSVGGIRLRGVYWYCGPCARGEHATEAFAPESISGAMRQLVCLLGATQASFAKASRVCGKVLGASISQEAVRRLCLRSGRQLEHQAVGPVATPANSELVGSCDGTRVHTREEQWRELKAYLFRHEAARQLYGPETPQGAAWAQRWCERLRGEGGRAVWRWLKRKRYKAPARQAAMGALLGFLDRHADRMDYPRYEREGYPISSGPLESLCKQLGRRLKGSGMRWSTRNVTPMAALVSLWISEEWDRAWRQAGCVPQFVGAPLGLPKVAFPLLSPVRSSKRRCCLDRAGGPFPPRRSRPYSPIAQLVERVPTRSGLTVVLKVGGI